MMLQFLTMTPLDRAMLDRRVLDIHPYRKVKSADVELTRNQEYPVDLTFCTLDLFDASAISILKLLASFVAVRAVIIHMGKKYQSNGGSDVLIH